LSIRCTYNITRYSNHLSIRCTYNITRYSNHLSIRCTYNITRYSNHLSIRCTYNITRYFRVCKGPNRHRQKNKPTVVLYRTQSLAFINFPLRLDYGRSPHAYVNQRLQIQLELLMMSDVPLETC